MRIGHSQLRFDELITKMAQSQGRLLDRRGNEPCGPALGRKRCTQGCTLRAERIAVFCALGKIVDMRFYCLKDILEPIAPFGWFNF
jgi:hypothetical protein